MRTGLSFHQATEALRGFLLKEKKPAKLCWIFREDVFQHKRRVFLRWPLPEENQSLAEEVYEAGRNKGLGLAPDVFRFDRRRAFCYVLVPEEEYDAGAMMMKALKLSYPTDRKAVIKVMSEWLWPLVKRLFFKQTEWDWTDLIPLRSKS